MSDEDESDWTRYFGDNNDSSGTGIGFGFDDDDDEAELLASAHKQPSGFERFGNDDFIDNSAPVTHDTGDDDVFGFVDPSENVTDDATDYGNLEVVPEDTGTVDYEPVQDTYEEPQSQYEDLPPIKDDPSFNTQYVEPEPKPTQYVEPEPVTQAPVAPEQPTAPPVPQYQPPVQQQSYHQSTTTNTHDRGSSFASMIPKELDVKSIKKIVSVVDAFRGFTQEEQNMVLGFFQALHSMGKSDTVIKGDNSVDDESAIIKSVLEVDPDIHDGVMELLKVKSMNGAERVFHMIDLPAHQLENINFILSMMDKTNAELHVQDSLPSIGNAAKQLNQILDANFNKGDVSTIEPIRKILNAVDTIMKE